MHTQDHTLETRRRLARHIATSIVGAVGALASAGLAIAVASAFAPGILRSTLLVGALLSTIATPVGLGLWSARHNLRCPGCNASFVRMRRAQPWAARPSAHCAGCGALLFGARASQARSRLAFVILMLAIAMVSGGAAYWLNARH